MPNIDCATNDRGMNHDVNMMEASEMVTGNAAPFPLHGLQQISFLPVSSRPVNTPLHGGEGKAALYGSANQYF